MRFRRIIEMATQVTIENNVKLERLLMSGTNMEKKAIDIMRKLVKMAREEVAAKAESAIQNDPRKTAHAIRSTVYKAVLGGNLNLLSSRRAGTPGPIPPVRHRLDYETNSKGNHRGGNRMPRSRRTTQMLGYRGFDRIFVLRFLDSGTTSRISHGGNRGSIAAINWFQNAGTQAFNNAAQNLESLIDELIQQELNA